MDVYRLYFLGPTGSVQMRKDFRAADDQDAIQIATFVAHYFATTCDGFALWQGSRQILEERKANEGALPRRRDIAAESEEVILSSRWHLVESEKLLAEIARLRREARVG